MMTTFEDTIENAVHTAENEATVLYTEAEPYIEKAESFVNKAVHEADVLYVDAVKVAKPYVMETIHEVEEEASDLYIKAEPYVEKAVHEVHKIEKEAKPFIEEVIHTVECKASSLYGRVAHFFSNLFVKNNVEEKVSIIQVQTEEAIQEGLARAKELYSEKSREALDVITVRYKSLLHYPTFQYVINSPIYQNVEAFTDKLTSSPVFQDIVTHKNYMAAGLVVGFLLSRFVCRRKKLHRKIKNE